MQCDPEDGRAMTRAVHRERGGRPWMQLVSAVLRLAGDSVELLSHAERPWSSVTFSGTRHTLCLAFSGQQAVEAGEAFIDALPEHEFTLSRYLVADAAVISVDRSVLPEPRLVVEAEFLLLDED
jgi:hypothetical protein